MVNKRVNMKMQTIYSTRANAVQQLNVCAAAMLSVLCLSHKETLLVSVEADTEGSGLGSE